MTFKIPSVAWTSAIALLVASGVGCSGRPTASPSGAPATNPAVGGEVHETMEPITLSAGVYETEVFTAAESEREIAVEKTQGPTFSGTVNGITVDPDYSEDCPVDWTTMTHAEVESHAIPTPTDLPPGAYQRYVSEGWECQGNILFVNRHFEFGPNDVFVGITRQYNTSTIRAETWESRVESGTIQGRPAVFIKPVTEAGSGNSYIAFKDGADILNFGGADIRFADLRRMAESFPLS